MGTGNNNSLINSSSESTLANSSTSENNQADIPTTSPNNSEINASQPKKKPRRTDNDFKSFYRDTHKEALSKLEKCTRSLSRLPLKLCCSILFISFGIFHRDTKISSGDAKKELNAAIESNPTWWQPVNHTLDEDSAPTIMCIN